MGILRVVLPVASIALALGGCGDIRSAGNSTETENSVMARSISVDSILDAGNHPLDVPTIATLRFASTNLDFSQVDSEGRDLVLETKSGSPVPFQIVFWDKTIARGLLRVRLDTSLLAPGSRFLFRWGQGLARRSDSTAVWTGIGDSQRVAVTSVLVDNFERGVLNNQLPDTSFWFIAALGSGTGLAPAGEGRSGSALRLVVSSPQTSGQYVLASTLLAPTPRSFRAMDSVVAWVRGTGKVRIAMEHMGGSGIQRAWAARSLTPDWQRVCVRPQDFDSAEGSGNIGWTGVRDSINYVTFVIEDGSELWVDDVRIHGIVRGDLQ